MHGYHTRYIIRITMWCITFYIIWWITTTFQTFGFVTLLLGYCNLRRTSYNGSCSGSSTQGRTNNRNTCHRFVGFHRCDGSGSSHLQHSSGKLLVGILLLDGIDFGFLLLFQLRRILAGSLGSSYLLVISAFHLLNFTIHQGREQLAETTRQVGHYLHRCLLYLGTLLRLFSNNVIHFVLELHFWN